jgi:hypothetical protein
MLKTEILTAADRPLSTEKSYSSQSMSEWELNSHDGYSAQSYRPLHNNMLLLSHAYSSLTLMLKDFRVHKILPIVVSNFT